MPISVPAVDGGPGWLAAIFRDQHPVCIARHPLHQCICLGIRELSQVYVRTGRRDPLEACMCTPSCFWHQLAANMPQAGTRRLLASVQQFPSVSVVAVAPGPPTFWLTHCEDEASGLKQSATKQFYSTITAIWAHGHSGQTRCGCHLKGVTASAPWNHLCHGEVGSPSADAAFPGDTIPTGGH
jgi:hypothetical protein